MANDLNLFQCIGRLGKDVETRYLPDGKAVVNMSLACGRTWKDAAGQKVEATEWIRVVAFDKLAEICAQYLAKGSQIYISGRMQTKKYQDKDGRDRYSTEIVADRMQMLGGRSSDNTSGNASGSGRSVDGGAHTPPAGGYKAGDGGFDEFDDDIPF